MSVSTACQLGPTFRCISAGLVPTVCDRGVASKAGKYPRCWLNRIMNANCIWLRTADTRSPYTHKYTPSLYRTQDWLEGGTRGNCSNLSQPTETASGLQWCHENTVEETEMDEDIQSGFKKSNAHIYLPGWCLWKWDHHVFIKYQIQQCTIPVPAVETLVQLSIYKACVVLSLFFTCDFVCILLYFNVLYYMDLESVIKVWLIDWLLCRATAKRSGGQRPSIHVCPPVSYVLELIEKHIDELCCSIFWGGQWLFSAYWSAPIICLFCC